MTISSIYAGGLGVIWAIIVPAGTWDYEAGNYNDITPISSTSDSRVIQYQSGRIAVALFVCGLLLIKWAISLLIPLKSTTSLSYKSALKMQEAKEDLPRVQGPVLASVLFSLFFAIIYDAFGSFPIFSEYGEMWVPVFIAISYLASLAVYVFIQDDLYVLPAKLTLKISLYLMIFNSDRLSLVMFTCSILLFIRVLNQLLLVRFHKFYIIDIIIKRHEKGLPAHSESDETLVQTSTLREAADNSLYIIVSWLALMYSLFVYSFYDYFSYTMYRSHFLYCVYFFGVMTVAEAVVFWLLGWGRQATDPLTPLSSVLSLAAQNYQNRSTRWALSSASLATDSLHPLPRAFDLALAGFSSQYFLTLALFGIGALSCAASVKIICDWLFNPFLDYWMCVVALLTGVVCFALKTAAVFAAKTVLWKVSSLNVLYDRGVDGVIIRDTNDHLRNELRKQADKDTPSHGRFDFLVSTASEEIIAIARGSDSLDQRVRLLADFFEQMDLLALINVDRCYGELAKELDIANPDQVKERLKNLIVPEQKVQLISAHRAKLDIPYPTFPAELQYLWDAEGEAVFPSVSLEDVTLDIDNQSSS